jgi:acetolactate synthase-1/3 small subunit
MEKKILSVLVENTSGVLNRVAGLFSRRGYNIDSLTVGETEDPTVSRMTIVVRGDDEVMEQIVKQINKLEDVREIIELKPGMSVCRELVLVKVGATAEQRQQVIAIAEIFRAMIVDVSKDSMMLALIGNTKVDPFIDLLEGFEVKEIVRTGTTGLTRGTADEMADCLECLG